MPHRDKLPLIANAYGFIFPSFDEGFGLPILEAMALGAPVITSTAGSLPEVVGDAALLVSPGDTDALVRAILEVATNESLRERLRMLGRLRARDFSWQRTAEETVKVYQKLLK